MTAPTYIVAVEGLGALRFMDEITPKTRKNALLAVNKVIRNGRVAVRRGIQKQVNFSASYLNSGNRLTAISATSANLEGRIVARTRPTSLARFTKDQPLVPGQRRRKAGIKVTVKPGVARYLERPFVIPLRSGADGSLSNRGLAIRSDTQPSGSYKPKRIGKNLWLLYGPSISQIMYSARNPKGTGVAEEVAPDLAVKLKAEFNRLMTVDLK